MSRRWKRHQLPPSRMVGSARWQSSSSFSAGLGGEPQTPFGDCCGSFCPCAAFRATRCVVEIIDGSCRLRQENGVVPGTPVQQQGVKAMSFLQR